MASEYSNLKIQLMGTGDNATTWGNITNVNIGPALGAAIASSVPIAFTSGDQTLTWTDTNGPQDARNLRLNLTGTGGFNLIVPVVTNGKPYIINNATDGTITVKHSTGTGITVPTGKTMWVYADGTNVVDVVTHLTSLSVAGALSVGSLSLTAPLPTASGGTGSNATTYCNLQANVTGLLPVANGGTGANTAATARSALGAAASGTNTDITTLNPTGGLQVGSPTGGAKGAGTVNATGLFVNGTAVGVGSGSVSSVAMTVPSFLSVTGSPITTSGTLAVTLSGVALPVANGGTGSTSAAAAATALGLGTSSSVQHGSFGVGTAASGTSGEIRATNNVTAYYSSDARLKENVQPIENALDIVSAVGGKTFDWTDDYIEEHGGEDGYFVTKSDFGVIAQDVQAVFPLAVRTRGDGTLAVDYEKLVAVAFAAINQLRAEVDELRGAK